MSNRKERRLGRQGIKAKQIEEREAIRKANEVAAEMNKGLTATSQKVVRKTTVTRRKLSGIEKPRQVQEEVHRQGGNLFPLWKIAKGPSTRTSANGDPHDRNYTVITRHLFSFNGAKEFKTMFFIPEDAEVVEVPENEDIPMHYRVRIGDAFVYISAEFGKIKPGMSIEGWTELKVKVVKKPNIGPREGFYPYANIWKPLKDNQESEFILNLGSVKWFVEDGDIAFTPASGKSETILHLSRINNVIKIIKE